MSGTNEGGIGRSMAEKSGVSSGRVVSLSAVSRTRRAIQARKPRADDAPPATFPTFPRAVWADLEARIARLRLTELATIVDADARALWVYQLHASRLNYTATLLADIARVQDIVVEHAKAHGSEEEAPLQFVIWGSNHDSVFNLGGDLQLFAELILNRDRAGLDAYARACIDVCHRNAVDYDLPLVTVSLVQGDALGGGFEHALSSDLIVAERRAKFGLPEILFGLFPGMGAYSFLARRLGAKDAERMIMSGRIHSAEELHAAGVVDILAEDGSGEIALEDYIRANYRHYAAQRSIYRIRRRFSPLTYAEMSDIADLWVGTALTLSDYDLRKMRRLSSAQTKRHVAPGRAAAEPRAEDGRRGGESA
jgi:DSF synthase